MFFCSLTVFAFVNCGGVVAPDTRKTIRFKDMVIGTFFFFLATWYTFKISFLFKFKFLTHIVQIVGNLLLLESIMRNKSAMAYWRHIIHRWRNNLWIKRSNRVGVVNPTEEETSCHIVEIPMYSLAHATDASSSVKRGSTVQEPRIAYNHDMDWRLPNQTSE